MYIFSTVDIASSMGSIATLENTLEIEGKLLEIEMASLDLSTTTLVTLGVSLMPSKWKHSLSHIVDLLISHIVDSLISPIVVSLISMVIWARRRR
jgi:hypothetical protein